MQYNKYIVENGKVRRETYEGKDDCPFCSSTDLYDPEGHSPQDVAYALQAAYNAGVRHASDAIAELMVLKQKNS